MVNDMLVTLNIIVVGGSISGLVSGLALIDLGHHVTILEKTRLSDLKDQGAGLAISQEAVNQFLEYFSLQPETYGFKANRLAVLNKAGEETFTMPWKGYVTNSGRLHRRLCRQFETLAKRDERGEIRFGCAVQDVAETEGGDKMRIGYLMGEERSSIEADLVIAADGASSPICRLVAHETDRKYAGYVALRGLADKELFSAETLQTVHEAGIFNWGADYMFVLYTIPDPEGKESDARLQNWVWYMNLNEEELKGMMTDEEGMTYPFTLPRGKMREEPTKKIQQKARAVLPPQLVETVEKTPDPFAQVVTDGRASENIFFNGKLILVGDAVCGLRPHITSGVAQEVLHAAFLR